MFKRVQKANAQHEKRLKKGKVEEDEGPRELAMDMDSESDSSEESESESESSSAASSSSEEEKNGKIEKNGKKADTKKRKLEEESEDDSEDNSEDDSDEEEDDDDDDDDDDDNDDSDEESDEEESEQENLSQKTKSTDPAEDALLRPSIQKAMEEPIFIKPNAIVRQGYSHRSCHLCPKAMIKTEKMIETHLKSGSHLRKVKRFSKELETLKSEQRKDPSEGGMNIVDFRDRVDKKLAKQQAGQQKVRDHAKQMKLEARRKRAVVKAANRQARKEAKLAKKAVMEAAGRQNGKAPNKKRKTEEGEGGKSISKQSEVNESPKQSKKPKEEMSKSIAKDIIQQKLTVLKQTEKDPRKLTKKYVKKHLLTNGERNELKKIKSQEKNKQKYEVRQRKREKKAAVAASKGSGEE